MTLLIICMIFFASFHLTAQTPGFEWAGQVGGESDIQSRQIAVDLDGNQIITGNFVGTADFDPSPDATLNLVSNGLYDCFIQKLGPSGNLLWAASMGDVESDVAFNVVTDGAGNIYMTGYFWGTIDADPGTDTYNITSFGGNDAYVLKLDISGNFVWAEQIGGPSYDSGGEIVFDDEGTFFVSGWFYGTSDFDPGAGTYYLTANGHADSYILKSDMDGNFIWAIQAGGPGWDYSMSLALDASGNIFNLGWFEETVDFDPGGNGEFELSNTGVRDTFVQKLNPAGSDDCVVPAGLEAANVTETSADLSWNPVSGAASYTVRYREIGTDWFYSGPLTGLNLSISGLNPIYAHEFQVKTDCESNFSYSLGFNTLGAGCPDNYEPNETIGTAVTIPVNTDITALINSPADVDWFGFSTTGAAKNIHIMLTSLPANYNIYLYKSDGTVIGSSLNPGIEDESIIYNSTKIGTYYIRVYSSGGVYDPADCYTVHVAISSTQYTKSDQAEIQIEEVSNNLTLYPNPASDLLNIDFNVSAVGNTKISILSPNGQVVFAKEYQTVAGSNHFTVPVNELKAGLYLVRLTTLDGEQTQKIMINK